MLAFVSKNHGGLNDFKFQQDGCGPYRAKSIKDYLDAKGIQLLPWLAQGPDLSPI